MRYGRLKQLNANFTREQAEQCWEDYKYGFAHTEQMVYLTLESARRFREFMSYLGVPTRLIPKKDYWVVKRA